MQINFVFVYIFLNSSPHTFLDLTMIMSHVYNMQVAVT